MMMKQAGKMARFAAAVFVVSIAVSGCDLMNAGPEIKVTHNADEKYTPQTQAGEMYRAILAAASTGQSIDHYMSDLSFLEGREDCGVLEDGSVFYDYDNVVDPATLDGKLDLVLLKAEIDGEDMDKATLDAEELDDEFDRAGGECAGGRAVILNSIRSGHLWPNGEVKYYWDSISSQAKAAFQQAMREWSSSVPGIKFTEVRKGQYNRGVVRLYSADRLGNSSTTLGLATVGYYSGSITGCGIKSAISNSEERRSAALHELGHTLGLTHEHVRPDRDTYLQSLFFLPKPSDWNNKYSYAQVTESPFDYRSVMLYSGFYLAKKSQQGMVAGQLIGTNYTLSNYDATFVSQLYPARAAAPAPAADTTSIKAFSLKNSGAFVSELYVIYRHNGVTKTYIDGHDITAGKTYTVNFAGHVPDGADVRLKAYVRWGKDKEASEWYHYNSKTKRANPTIGYTVSGTTWSNKLKRN